MTKTARLTARERNRYQHLLQAKLEDLRVPFGAREDLRAERLADPADQIRSDADLDLAVRQSDTRARQVQAVQAALDRIADGTFGECASCGEPIATKRLNLVPWAPLCVSCQEAAEAEEEGHSHQVRWAA